MKFMVIVKADKDSEAGVMPSKELLTQMGNYNEELVKAGVMLAGRRPAPDFEGRARQIRRQQAHGDRRTV